MNNRLQRLSAIAFLCLSASGLFAQQSRIAARIDRTQTVVLAGHTPARTRRQFDRGAVDPSFVLPAVTLHLKPSSAQQTALDQLLREQQDPASPNYHQWLTPEQYADRFGVSQSDIDKIKEWLEAEGFTVNAVGRSRTWVLFSGTAEQAEASFKTPIHHFTVNGISHYANTTEPSIPAALANIVAGFHGLDNFRLKPRSHKAQLSPEMTSSGGVHHVVPDDLATIYDIAPLYTAGIDGTGQSIVVVGQTDITLSDLQTFRSRFNLPALNLKQVLVPGHPDPGISDDDLGEADLDLEWAGAVARNATIVYVYSDDVSASAIYAVDQNLAPVLSMSYGACEASDMVDLPTMQATARQANAQGMTWLAASGDAGAADCEDPSAAVAQNGLAVDAPASIPEVTGMGGTEFNEQGGSYWALSNSGNSASALSYIPEKAWNDTALDGALSAGGGGPSLYFSKPAWQTGPGVPNDSYRHVPDLSLSSSADHDGFYVYTGGSGAYYGGTSIAAPSMAGVVALLNQYLVSTGAQKQSGLGNINPALYRMAQTTTSVFHDVTTGNNIVPCASGSSGCTNGSYGFSAGTGYDQATGLGSIDASNLIHQWAAHPATASAVVVAIDSNPVFQLAAAVGGNNWTFTLTLTEEAGVGTTLTSFTIDGKTYDIAATFGSATIPALGSLASQNLGFATLDVPKTVVFAFAGVDPSGSTWSQQLSVPFTGIQTPLVIGGVSNAASGQQSYAPGMIASVYGTALGNFAQSTATLPLPDYLAGFEAAVNGVYAPLYYVSPNQVNLQIPYETPVGSATLMVGNPYVNVSYTIQVTAAAPGIFASNGSISPPFSSAQRGQASTLFLTGDGAQRPSLATGASPATGTSTSRLPKSVLPVSVTVGGEQATVLFNGIPSGLVGVTQINFTVPADLAPGVYPVVVTVGTVATPPVNLTVTQ